jgi:general L-amino acid transport system permease protein
MEAFVRTEEAPRLPAPASTVGIVGWLRANLFSSVFNSILTLAIAAFVFWIVSKVAGFAIFDAVWHGVDREACIGEGKGACWPMVADKLPQWIYGFYPADQRWRVNLCFLLFAAGAIPMMIPSVPFKRPNIIFMLVAFPLIALILLSGGNANFGLTSYARILSLLGLLSVFVPIAAYGLEDGVAKNKIGLALAGLSALLWLASFAVNGLAYGPYLNAGVAALSLAAAYGDGVGRRAIAAWAVASAVLLAAMVLLDIDFGLVQVETPQWGGLLVTVVVALTGIVASLPIGILLALGRRSRMPAVRLLCVTFIELIRGVPLITVLFMSSVMLPLFLPPGVSFDKLLRALIGVGLFSAAYMAEAIRGGLQAIPKGQYEGAMAVGLSYWQMMNKIVLPQALRISIPNIVGNFIALFKDTTLVLIIGLFDLLGILQTSLRDSKWASASSAPTGYLFVGLLFWIFCFAMSRYANFTERRLATGYKR